MKLKHLIFLSLCLIFYCGTKVHAASYGMAGCGLGALIFKDQPGKIQILGATTNNWPSPQSFAITSGTSNCFEEDIRQEASLYISVNQESLQNDISKGQGETLSGLLKIYQCPEMVQLGVSLQKSYSKIFPKLGTSATEVNDAIESTLRSNQELSRVCRVFS